MLLHPRTHHNDVTLPGKAILQTLIYRQMLVIFTKHPKGMGLAALL
jgi:hypothetical protein